MIDHAFPRHKAESHTRIIVIWASPHHLLLYHLSSSSFTILFHIHIITLRLEPGLCDRLRFTLKNCKVVECTSPRASVEDGFVVQLGWYLCETQKGKEATIGPINQTQFSR